jgi:hypothetical protein
VTATVPGRPELDGTVAARLAAMRADAAHALWAVPFGADGEAAWLACPRADWLVDAVALSRAYAPGSEVHRRAVAALGVAAGEVLRRSDVADSARFTFEALLFAVERWARGEEDPMLVVRLGDAASARVGLAAREQGLAGGDGRLVAAFACHLAASAMVDPRAASGAALAASVGLSGGPESPEVCDWLRWALGCPEELGGRNPGITSGGP